MAKYTNSYKVTIDFKPWFDSGFQFTKLHMVEELGGKIPGGEIDMNHDGSEAALKLITDQYTGHLSIEKEGGNIYEIDIFITQRRFYKNSLSLSFICITDKKFFTELIEAEWDDITGALEALYPGKKDIRIKSDINNSIKIFQNHETNYSLCTKLAYSFKHNCIFAYGWEGFKLKDIIGEKDSQGNVEPKLSITGNVEIHQIDSYHMHYNKKIYYTPENPWDPDYLDYEADNNKTIMFYDNHYLIGTDYYQLVDNYLFNKKYMETELFTSFRAVDLNMPKYKIGDVLKYSRAEQDTKLPFELFLVQSNELFYAVEGSNATDSNGLNFSWTSKLIGLEEGGSVLPDSDPTN